VGPPYASGIGRFSFSLPFIYEMPVPQPIPEDLPSSLLSIKRVASRYFSFFSVDCHYPLPDGVAQVDISPPPLLCPAKDVLFCIPRIIPFSLDQRLLDDGDGFFLPTRGVGFSS